MKNKIMISYTLNVVFGLILVVIFGSIVATGKVQPWEPNPIIAYIELFTGIAITLFGAKGVFNG